MPGHKQDYLLATFEAEGYEKVTLVIGPDTMNELDAALHYVEPRLIYLGFPKKFKVLQDGKPFLP